MDKTVKIAMEIAADYKYIYDPEHDNKPNGSWKMTGSGWSSNDGDAEPEKSVVHQPAKQEESKPKPPAPPVQKEPPKHEPLKQEDDEQKSLVLEDAPEENPEEKPEEKPEDEGEDLFKNDEEGEGDGFVTDEEGKEEENEETSDDGFNLDGDDDATLDLGEEENPFDAMDREAYLDESRYDEYIEKMNAFIQKFDEGEGKENDVTFKAIASNLDWSSASDVKAFIDHCEKKEIEGAEEVLAFLYFQHDNDEEKFEKIIEEMK